MSRFVTMTLLPERSALLKEGRFTSLYNHHIEIFLPLLIQDVLHNSVCEGEGRIGQHEHLLI